MFNDHAHLKDQFHLLLQPVLVTIHKTFSAVSALNDELLSSTSSNKHCFEVIGLHRVDEWREFSQLVKDLGRKLFVLPFCHLQSLLAAPRCW